MNNKMYFSIPGLYGFNSLNMKLFELIKTYPEKFNPDFEITSMYGCFPQCIWNGARAVSGEFNPKDVEGAVSILNQLNVTCRYTFTNCLLNENDMYDRVGNQILNITKQNQIIKNDINVGCDVMREYIEKNFKDDFNVMLSTTLCIKDVDEINKVTEKYLLVPDYSINNNFEKLSKLIHPENIEILVNESCKPNCPARRKHYEELSCSFLKENIDVKGCIYKNDPNYINYFRSNTTWSHHVTVDDIRTKYLPLGINKFKIVGRGISLLKVIEGYVEYFVKPEYQNEIRYDLLDYALS